jgi:mRNA-degrading endonuclease toxin of MazEF toxin-antitoxin module
VSEGDIWWAAVWENIWVEISGKWEKYSRPVIIYKKLSHRASLCIPTSTQIREWNWYVPLQYQDMSVVACLHQIRIIDHKRLYGRICQLPSYDKENIADRFLDLYQKSAPSA